jgi:hypothetical protein
MESALVVEMAGPVKESDLKSRYKIDRAKFLVPETIVFDYYFTPEAEHIQTIWDAYEAGTPFEDVGKTVTVKGGMHGGKTALQMKNGRVPRVEELTEMAEAIFTLKEGELRVLDAALGYYFCRINEIIPEHYKPFEDVTSAIERTIIQERGGEKAAERIKELESKLKITLTDERQDGPPPQRAPAFQELG